MDPPACSCSGNFCLLATMCLTVGGSVRTCCDTLRERMTSPTRARAQASLAACVGKGRGVVGHDVQIAHASEVFVWCPKARFCGRRCSTHTTRPRQRTKPAASTTGRKRAKREHRGQSARRGRNIRYGRNTTWLTQPIHHVDPQQHCPRPWLHATCRKFIVVSQDVLR